MTEAAITDHELDGLVERLTVEEKVSVLTGGSAWSSTALPSIGLRAMVLSDGPSGVRGATWDERDPSLCLPSATALSSTWDTAMAARYGAVAAAEARRKGVDVVLGPTVNLHRSPLGGRQFEAFSEDPLLTADLAAAYVRGMQERGVAATLKHYVANDSETDRYTVDVRVDEQPLHELYLAAFERAVCEAGAWCVMSAYNSVNGATMTENDLLMEPLKATWDFDGVVLSDWTAVRSVNSALYPQDLAMPGPDGPWGSALVKAISAGEVPEALVDGKVRRILRLAARVGALDGHESRSIGTVEDGVTFAREAAAEGMVLIRNDGILPIATTSPSRIAVIGEHAAHPRIQGGGSATVMPHRAISPLEGIEAALGDLAVIEYEPGAIVQEGFVPLHPGRMTNPETGGPGARITYLGADGSALYTDDRFAAMIIDFAARPLDQQRSSMVFETIYTPAVTGAEHFGFASPGHGRLLVDGRPILDEVIEEQSDQVQAFFSPPYLTTAVEVIAGRPLVLRYEFTPGTIVDGIPGSISVTFGTELPPRTHQEELALRERAVKLAESADLVVVVVGTTELVECEGYDRDSLRLPGLQDELVIAVAAANPKTIVVVNSGAAVEMPWREQVAAVLLGWFGGQEFGHAIADVLTGVREPGGRLPTTWPARLDDAPVSDVTPVEGTVRYREGIHIGYRAWLRSDIRPAYPFGHGLGYTTWGLGAAHVELSPVGVDVIVPVTNTGTRPGKQIIQVYARRPESEVERPALWLVGFAALRARPGETIEIRVEMPIRAFSHWADGWWVEGGLFEIFVGTSATELCNPLLVMMDGRQLTESDRYPYGARTNREAVPVPARVVIVGSANEDLTLHVEQHPAPGQTVLARSGSTAVGGKGLNQAIAAAGVAATALVAAVGDDDAGQHVAAMLRRHQMPKSGLMTSDQQTGRAIITLDSFGENSIVVLGGANTDLTPQHVRRALDEIEPVVVVTQLEVPIAAANTARDWALEHDVPFVVNFSPYRSDARHLIRTADPLIVNTAEAREILGDSRSAIDAALSLSRQARTAVVTDGGNGAYLAEAGVVVHIPAGHAQVVDTTGAGDAMAGTLAASLANGLGLREAVEAAVCEASRIVGLSRSDR